MSTLNFTFRCGIYPVRGSHSIDINKYYLTQNMKTSRTNRSRVATWLALVLGIAAATSVEAATVQITRGGLLPANLLAYYGYNGLQPALWDVTGDGVAEADITATFTWGYPYSSPEEKSISLKNTSTGVIFAYSYWNSQYGENIVFGSAGLTQMNFTDTRINGGAPFGGWLETDYGGVVDHQNVWVPFVRVARLVFNDDSTTAPSGPLAASYSEFVPASAVPEPSSLGLLALGAACLLTRRRLTRKA
jgi:hypothetical protein